MLQESVLHVIEPNPVLGQCNKNTKDWRVIKVLSRLILG